MREVIRIYYTNILDYYSERISVIPLKDFLSFPSGQISTYGEGAMQRCVAAMCVCVVSRAARISGSELLSVH